MKKVLIVVGIVLVICIGLLVYLYGKPKANKQPFKIIDETEVCADALEGFYKDAIYEYYFPCIKSSNVFVKFADGRKIPVKEALNSELVTIKELEEQGLSFYKELRIK